MAGWGVKKVGELDLYHAATLTWLPGVLQGFTTRRGGVGRSPYDSLNLSLNCGDDEAAVLENRRRLAEAIDVDQTNMVFAEQIHGDSVAVVDGPQAVPVPGVDALITGTPGLVLTMVFADCMPIYIVEPLRRVVAIVHAGRRGCAANIVRQTTEVLIERFDITPRSCQVAIGPSISADHYEVDAETADEFRDGFVSGASTPVLLTNEFEGKYSLSLRSVAFAQLLAAGYKPDSIAVCDEDTFGNSRDFFSYRRESRSDRKTGRMAGFIGLNSRYRVAVKTGLSKLVNRGCMRRGYRADRGSGSVYGHGEGRSTAAVYGQVRGRTQTGRSDRARIGRSPSEWGLGRRVDSRVFDRLRASPLNRAVG